MSNSNNITGESLLYLTDNQLRQGIEAMFFAYRGFTADPDKILEELDRKIINGLSNENGVERQDGMDMSIVTINAKKQRLYFACDEAILIKNDYDKAYALRGILKIEMGEISGCKDLEKATI